MIKKYDVIVVGSGAAGFSTADWLYSFGIENICIVTEGINCGTSRNTGSDKQTYYKLDICGNNGDSIKKMAQDLSAGGAMNGSDAFIEAANSVRCFIRLAQLGVPFPTDSYGRYAGYRTDHDNTCRATSAGPLTSKYMTEQLQKKVENNGTPVIDDCRVIKLIVSNNKCCGVICRTENGFETIYSKAVILCTGAPAAMYAYSVYPESQTGATGLAVEAGADLSNFQEWQYGIASVGFRWNLSGSYQQVIPRYYSVSPDGTEKEFLVRNGNYGDIYTKVFLKGYQWPFDSKKTEGSSEIDILVFNELENGNRVFLDYTKNPEGFCFDELSAEAQKYLTDTECLAGTPIERLIKLNPKAVKLYKNNGTDLTKEPLEIRICAQHNNGGIKTDLNSETTVKNLFAAGEAAGKFGVYRPGGSALNDTQVGGLRAAEYLAKEIKNTEFDFTEIESPQLPEISTAPTLEKYKSEFSLKMSVCAGMIRDHGALKKLLCELEELKSNFYEYVTVADPSFFGEFYAFRLTVLSMITLCRTEIAAIEKIGSRGGCICCMDGVKKEENTEYRKYITVTSVEGVHFEPADEIPDETPVFEKLLKQI